MTHTMGDQPPALANFMLVVFLFGIAASAIGFAYIAYIHLSQDHDACEDLNNRPFGIVLWQCADGMEANTEVTGRQLLDHYSIPTVDEMLSEQIVPYNGE